MKVNITKKIEGQGNKLYSVGYTEGFDTFVDLYLGNDFKDVLQQFFKMNNWDEEYVMDTFNNVGWVFNDDWDEEDYEGEGVDRIELELIGEVVE